MAPHFFALLLWLIVCAMRCAVVRCVKRPLKLKVYTWTKPKQRNRKTNDHTHLLGSPVTTCSGTEYVKTARNCFVYFIVATGISTCDPHIWSHYIRVVHLYEIIKARRTTDVAYGVLQTHMLINKHLFSWEFNRVSLLLFVAVAWCSIQCVLLFFFLEN